MLTHRRLIHLLDARGDQLTLNRQGCLATRRRCAPPVPSLAASPNRSRRPAHCDHDRVLLGLPVMVDARSPERVVALVLKGKRTHREVEPELTAHEDQQRGALLPGYPLPAVLAGGVDAPLDLDVAGGSDAVLVVEEVAYQPTTVVLPIGVGVPEVPVVGHHASASSSGTLTRDAVSSSASRRSPSTKANSPSLL